ncbi:MAG: CDP-archaeol synthase [Patescibacteria group bacterium]|jgi:CDP-2,3-bis-(O-geranylgeranyl)-sn-glycerol synthase
MGIIILKAFYFALPAYFGNMAPVFLAKLKWFEFLNVPVDFDKRIGGQAIFGNHKTWRGLISAPIAGIFICFIQLLIYKIPFFNSISLFNYSEHWLWFGFLAGLGAIIGDLIKSFFKRRLRINPGMPWPILDQLDLTIGFLAFTFWIVRPDLFIVWTLLFLGIILGYGSNLIAYELGLKKVWW